MTSLPISRFLLEKYFGDDQRMLRAMEELSQNGAAVVDNVAATTGMNNATVITLSQNDQFVNEYVLQAGYGIILDINPGNVGIRVDPTLCVTTSAPVLKLSTIPTFASDVAAAAGGVQIGGQYRNGSVMMIRVT